MSDTTPWYRHRIVRLGVPAVLAAMYVVGMFLTGALVEPAPHLALAVFLVAVVMGVLALITGVALNVESFADYAVAHIVRGDADA